MPKWTALSFQDPSSPIMEQVLLFHDHIMTILILITTLTMLILFSLFPNKSHNKFINEGQEIEMIWTIIPAMILTLVAFPSMKILYMMEDTKTPKISTKAIGHQWYWSYEHPTKTQTETENFLESSNIIRLMKTSEILNLPVQETTRVLITSSDVIHSWALPAMGSKVDALPGRINQTFILSKRLGMFTGQCSEICGSNHSFMPILVQFSSPKDFIKKMEI